MIVCRLTNVDDVDETKRDVAGQREREYRQLFDENIVNCTTSLTVPHQDNQRRLDCPFENTNDLVIGFRNHVDYDCLQNYDRTTTFVYEITIERVSF